MALADRRSDKSRHKITDAAKLRSISSSFAEGKHVDLQEFPGEAGLLYQIQQMEEDIDSLRTFVTDDSVGIGIGDILGTDHAWIPGTHFNSDDAVYTRGAVSLSSTTARLRYEWPGMQGRTVTHAHVYSSQLINDGCFFFRYTGPTATVTTTLASKQDSGVSLDITDWECRIGETLLIELYPRSTSTNVYGVLLTLS